MSTTKEIILDTTNPVDWTRPVFTRAEKYPVTVVCRDLASVEFPVLGTWTDSNGKQSGVFTKEGRFRRLGREGSLDLLNERIEPVFDPRKPVRALNDGRVFRAKVVHLFEQPNTYCCVVIYRHIREYSLRVRHDGTTDGTVVKVVNYSEGVAESAEAISKFEAMARGFVGGVDVTVSGNYAADHFFSTKKLFCIRDANTGRIRVSGYHGLVSDREEVVAIKTVNIDFRRGEGMGIQ